MGWRPERVLLQLAVLWVTVTCALSLPQTVFRYPKCPQPGQEREGGMCERQTAPSSLCTEVPLADQCPARLDWLPEGSVCFHRGLAFNCSMGKWTRTDDGVLKLQHREKRFVEWIIGGAIVACFLFCSKVFNNPPSIGCPGDISKITPAGQSQVQISWNVPGAYDPNGGTPSITRTRGPRPGSMFSEGTTYIGYIARDWGGLTDSCQFTIRVKVVRCPVARAPINGPHPQCNGAHEKNQFGALCLYSCDEGYELKGQDTLTCEQNGTWSHPSPTCAPISCGQPPEVSGGYVECDNGHSYQAICSLVCDAGYNNTGPVSTSCTASGEWTLVTQPCRAISCGQPPEVSGGYLECDNGHSYQAICSLVCDAGYSHTGPVSTSCTASGEWTLVKPCRDTEGPTFPHGCPADQQVFSGPLQSPVIVTWSDPDTHDNSKKSVDVVSSPESGSSFRVGFHRVKVTATDEEGNSRSCKFYVNVQPRECPGLDLHNGRMICDNGHVEGSTCTASCIKGYKVKGQASVTCQDDSTWSPAMPLCQKVTCPAALLEVENGNVMCYEGREYQDMCTLSCNHGYRIQPPTYIICRVDGTWSLPGSCRDAAPPVLKCPDPIELFAAPLGQETIVTWDLPDVSDNSGEKLTATGDVTPGSDFKVGVTYVTYTARDSSGNEGKCRLPVNVKTQSCSAPDFKDPAGNRSLIVYQCPQAYVHGARCTLKCSHGFPLLGAKTITCVRDDSLNPPVMSWKFDGSRPQCFENECPELQPPKNGALSCMLGNYGQDCYMSCHESYDIPNGFHGHFVCANSNHTWQPPTVEDCSKIRRPEKAKLKSEFLYFPDSCETSLQQTKENFIRVIQASKFQDACVDVPTCTVDNVLVTCGPTDPRRRRSARSEGSVRSEFNQGRHRRGAASSRRMELVIEFEIVVDFVQSGSEEETFSTYKSLERSIYSVLKAEGRKGAFDLGSLTPDLRYLFSPTLTFGGCPNGTRYYQRDTSTKASCVGCSKGHYLNDTRCSPCPKGQYKELDNATSCTDCPPGFSTLTTASESRQDCKKICTPGHFSPTGFEDCQPCPSGSYQSRDQSVTCDLCPSGTWTEYSASKSRSDCVAVDQCASSPCGQQGVCENGPSGFHCHCQDGWSGDTCQVPPDGCYQNLCPEDAQCVPAGRNYTCQCPEGRTGRLCQLEKVDGEWGEWGQWSLCSSTCGGIHLRQRRCNNPAPANGGRHCSGQERESESCGETECEEEEAWSAWSSWSACSATCGGGERNRTRTCESSVPPEQGSATCTGPDHEVTSCATAVCPVHGGWGNWSEWSPCSATCGGGNQSRERSCDSPVPTNGGEDCQGVTNQTQACNSEECPECSPLPETHGTTFTCNETDAPYQKTCRVRCSPGYSTALPEVYLCGQMTGYRWNFQRANATMEDKDVIHYCTPVKTPIDVRMNKQIPFSGASCGQKELISRQVNINLKRLPCVQQGKCSIQVTADCPAILSPSSYKLRQKRSAESVVIHVDFKATFGHSVELNGNDSSSLEQFIKDFQMADQSAAMMVLDDTESLFTVTVDDVIITPDVSESSYSLGISCSPGSVAAEGAACVDCPVGSFEEKGRCVPCPLGQYQDRTGSTQCQRCPPHTTWDTPGATHVSQCFYKTTEEEELSQVSTLIFAGTGAFLGVVVITFAVACWLVRREKSVPLDATTTEALAEGLVFDNKAYEFTASCVLPGSATKPGSSDICSKLDQPFL